MSKKTKQQRRKARKKKELKRKQKKKLTPIKNVVIPNICDEEIENAMILNLGIIGIGLPTEYQPIHRGREYCQAVVSGRDGIVLLHYFPDIHPEEVGIFMSRDRVFSINDKLGSVQLYERMKGTPMMGEFGFNNFPENFEEIVSSFEKDGGTIPVMSQLVDSKTGIIRAFRMFGMNKLLKEEFLKMSRNQIARYGHKLSKTETQRVQRELGRMTTYKWESISKVCWDTSIREASQ